MAIEILAPVGGEEQLVAAVRAGADAVYLGGRGFNARRNASNFDGDGLKRAVEYCHGRGVRVHVTCNTLVLDREMPALYEEIKSIAESGADAVIVQDLAVMELFRRHCPEMELHASTQMTIHNAGGAAMAERLGFSRAVLARELSLDEIRLVRAGCGIELEVFVHGALCMSVSGQCYLSSMLGGRSGNRGLCAQPCRLNFSAGEREYALSLRDLSAVEYISQLEQAGVSSLKIEGRMKRPEYVAAAVTACRAAAAGEKPDMDALRAVFSRSGFTDGYLTGRRGIDMFGIRTREDVQASSEVMGSIAASYRAERQSVPVSMAAELRAGEKAKLTVSDGERRVTAAGSAPQKAQNRGLDFDRVRKSLEKTGGTPFYVSRFSANVDEGLYMSPAELNAMRREALNTLLEHRSWTEPKRILGEPEQMLPAERKKRPALRLRFERAEQIFDGAGEAELIYLPLSEINGDIISRFGDRLAAELPRFIPAGDGTGLESRLAEFKKLGLRKCAAGNIGDIGIIDRVGLEALGGFSLNVINSRANAVLSSLGIRDTVLSFELSLRDAGRVSGECVGIIGYGYLPLMLYRCCPMKGINGCNGCSGHEKLRDRTGREFTVLCGNRKYSTMLNALPLYIGDKNVDGVDFELLYFTLESSARCRRVWEMFRSGAKFDGERTRGLYYRELL